MVVQVAIQVSQRKSAKAVEAGFKMQSTNKAATLQLALSRLTRRAFRKESECRMQYHKTTRPQAHKTTGAT